ncbi:MAG: DNA gyrase inhibitor YacG [Pseudomonadota bacterium]
MSITVSCPTCQTEVEWSEHSPNRPFCSERCKLIDLGEWANEEKSIPGEPAVVPEQDPVNDDHYGQS